MHAARDDRAARGPDRRAPSSTAGPVANRLWEIGSPLPTRGGRGCCSTASDTCCWSSPSPPSPPPPARVEAQTNIGEELIDRFNSLFPVDHSRPMTVSELCCRLDCITEELRDKGMVLVKQPDVFSQARMTRFRNDFDNQLSSDLANFHLVLAARINRLDSATTTSATALGAALSAPGTTNVSAPSAGSGSDAASLLNPSSGLFPAYTQPNLFGGSAPGAFNSLGVGPMLWRRRPPPAPRRSLWALSRRSTSRRSNGSSTTSITFGGSTSAPIRTTRQATVCISCGYRYRLRRASALIRATAPTCPSRSSTSLPPTSCRRRSAGW